MRGPQGPQGPGGPGSSDQDDTRWDAYTDFQHISRRTSDKIFDAVEAVATLEAAKLSGEKLKPREETDLRTTVDAAVTLLRTELQNERDRSELYDEILSRWEGEEGFINRFEAMNATNTRPEPWLGDFAQDIHRAGWELGYLKAGREQKETSSGDPYDGQVRDMFDGGSE